MKKTSQKTRTDKYRVGRAKSGLGLFATESFQKGDFVIEYTGEKLPTKVADERNSLYLFVINSRWTVDGRGRENLSRYINHSCRPNCEPVIEGHNIMIYATRKINPGDELTYNYGKEYFNEYIKPFGCRCDFCLKKK